MTEIDVPEDDFVELTAPRRVTQTPTDPVVMGVMALGRSGATRLSLRVQEDILRAVAGDGWPRFTVAFSPKGLRFRIAGAVQGPFEVIQMPKMRAGTVMLRFPPPEGLLLAEPGTRLAAYYQEAGGALYVDLPMKLLQAPRALPAPARKPEPEPPPAEPDPLPEPPPADMSRRPPPLPAPGKKLSRADMLKQAADRFRAPKF